MTQRKIKMAIVGATGLVGRELLEALEGRRFPVEELKLFASLNSAGERMAFGDGEIMVEAIRADFHRGCQIVLFAAHPMVSRDLAEQAAAEGSLVIDASRTFRLDPAVPLAAADINPNAAAEARKGKGIVASPSAAALAVATAAGPLHRAFGLDRLIVTTIHGTTSAGHVGLEEHQQQTIAIFNQQKLTMEKFPRQTAFNIFPDVGGFLNGTDNQAERELLDEVPRLLGTGIAMAATAALAPIFCGLSASVNVELKSAATLEAVREVLGSGPGLEMVDDPSEDIYPDSILAMEREDILVGRLRVDPGRPRCFQFYLAADNLRKCSAINMVRIAEQYIRGGE
jgi:aspartate-semialdehyde dehydrogenase